MGVSLGAAPPILAPTLSDTQVERNCHLLGFRLSCSQPAGKGNGRVGRWCVVCLPLGGRTGLGECAGEESTSCEEMSPNSGRAALG